jgi:hypothetical protein
VVQRLLPNANALAIRKLVVLDEVGVPNQSDFLDPTTRSRLAPSAAASLDLYSYIEIRTSTFNVLQQVRDWFQVTGINISYGQGGHPQQRM